MKKLITTVLMVAFALGCATTTTTLPDGTEITEREWDVSTIWEMARIAKEIKILNAELKEREHEMSMEERQQVQDHIDRLVERIKD